MVTAARPCCCSVLGNSVLEDIQDSLDAAQEVEAADAGKVGSVAAEEDGSRICTEAGASMDRSEEIVEVATSDQNKVRCKVVVEVDTP